MILVRLKGGLGNQMFQYAAGRALADRHGVELLLDSRFFASYKLHAYGLDRLAISSRHASLDELERWPIWQRKPLRIVQRLGIKTRWYCPPQFGYDRLWSSLGDDLMIDGYFQSEKYFASIADVLTREFTPKDSLSASNNAIREQAQQTESVMIHVRRGDYVTDPKTLATHGVCSPAYYDASIQYLRERLIDPQFFVFSNDMEWARENLDLGKNAIYVEGNEKSPEIDIYLMTQCSHHVVANSSFSWWGAWLSRDPCKLVVAPKHWFVTDKLNADELVPSGWVRL